MKLFQHPDFEQAILAAAEHFETKGLRPAIIEKDYYVTEALRIIAAVGGDRIIFKGGTSLSKGWDLIQRFSEDIDLFLDPQAFDPALGTNAINRELKKLRDAVDGHEALTFNKDQSKTFGGSGRNDQFEYPQLFGGAGEIANRVFLESGTASGREPRVNRTLESYLAEFLRVESKSLDCEDESGFQIPVLHFRRTFVEKMFAIHGKVEQFKNGPNWIRGYARHYYDLYQLAGTGDVIEMLRTDEYDQIKADYDRISREHFPKGYFAPDDMRFSNSDALFPNAELSAKLKVQYEQQCQVLCYGSYPSWEDVLDAFGKLKALI